MKRPVFAAALAVVICLVGFTLMLTWDKILAPRPAPPTPIPTVMQTSAHAQTPTAPATLTPTATKAPTATPNVPTRPTYTLTPTPTMTAPPTHTSTPAATSTFTPAPRQSATTPGNASPEPPSEGTPTAPTASPTREQAKDLPDITPVWVAYSYVGLGAQGAATDISVTIMNIGRATAENFWVAAYIDREATPGTHEAAVHWLVPSLAANATTILSLEEASDGGASIVLPPGRYVISVETNLSKGEDMPIAESITANNRIEAVPLDIIVGAAAPGTGTGQTGGT